MPLYDVDVEGVTYEVTAPDENTAWQWANYTHRQKRAGAVSQQKAPPESGFGPAFRAGIEGLMGAGAAFAGRTGLMDMAEAEKAVEARRQRQAEIFKPTEEWGITKLTELLGGSIPYMAAPLAAAGAAAALPLTGTAAAVAGLGAAGLASATQFTGTNLSRQIEEGKKLADTDLGAAALASLPQAALDTLSLRMLPGVGKLLGDAGIKVTKETAKEVSEQILKKAAIDYAAATGRAMTAEGLTEAAQQGFERLQAGLSLTDADARKEYFDSLVGGALLGGTIAPAGRMLERGKAKREVAAIEQEEADTAAKAAREAEEARKQQPEYMEGLYTTYQDLLAQKKALDAQIKKESKEAPLSQDDKDANAVINRQLAELKQPLKRAQQAFIDAGGPQALAAARTRQLQPTPEEVPGTEQELEEQRRERLLAELDRAQLIGDTKRASALQQQLQESAPESPEALRSRLTRDVPYLQALLERQREQIQAAKTPEAAAEIAARAQKTYEALAQANARLGELPQAPDIAELQQKEQALLKAFEDARDAGDQQTVLKVVPELRAVRRQLQEVQPFDLASAEYAAEEDRKRAELGEAIGAGREIAAAEREQAGTEQQVAREQAARSAALQEQLELEGTAEREAMSELAASRAADMRMRELEALRGAPQLALFPEQREKVTRTEAQQTERERPAEVAPLRSELARLLRERRALEREAAQAQPAPGAELAGPASLFVVNTQDRIRTLDTRIAEIEEQLTGLTAPGVETRTVSMPPEAPQPDLRPQGPLAARLNTLAERVLASPRVDEDTKALVREVQDNLPFLLRQDPVAQRTLGRRGALLAGQQEGQSVGAWLYRTMLGTAPPELTENIRDRLRKLEAVRRSETERLPTGELRRAVQTEIELPEPTATAFESFEDFSDYLASEGLQTLRAADKDVRDSAIPNAHRINVTVGALNKQASELENRLTALAQQRRDALKQPEAGVDTAREIAREAEAELQRVLRGVGPGAIFVSLFEGRLPQRIQQTKESIAAAEAAKADLFRRFQENIDSLNKALAAYQPVSVAPAKGMEPETVMLRYEATAIKRREALEADAKKSGEKLKALIARLQQVQARRADAQNVFDAVNAVTDPAERVIKQKENANKILSLSTLLREERKLRNDISAENTRFLRLAQQSLSKAPFKVPVLRDSLFKNFLVEEAKLTDLLNANNKQLSQLSANLSSARTKLNNVYSLAEELGGTRLQSLRNQVLSANQLIQETQQALTATRSEVNAPENIAEARALRVQADALKAQAQELTRGVAARAEARRGVPAKETQGEREARDAALRREEQARLERQEAIPGTRIEFEREETKDTTLDSLIVKAEMAKTREARAAVVKETQDYLNARVAKLDNDLKEMQAKAAKNIKDVQQARKNVAALTDRLEKNVTEKGRQMTPKQRETAERKLEEAKRKLAEHERRYTMNTREMKIKRTDIQAERAAKKQALADVQARFEPGQRLGEAEGTTAGRAIGPVTRPEVYPPKTMRTGSEESRMGVTTTDTRQRLQEARGVRQRDIAMTSEEMQSAEQAAAEMKTLAGLEKAEKALAAEREAANARGLRPGEFDRFEAREEILKARRAALEREAAAAKPAEPEAEAPKETAEAPEVEEEVEEAPKKRGRKAAAVEEMEEELDSFEVELLPTEGKYLSEQNDEFLPTPKRPNGPAVKTRILPDGKRQQVPRVAATPSKLPRIDDGAPDNDFYKVTGFVPDTSAPFHKMTLADAARFGASKARGQRKELFTRLAELFGEAPTPEKQGLVLATNGRRSSSGAYGAFYRQSNVVFTPGPNSAKYLDTLLHELTHAASSYALSVDKRLAARVEALRSKAAAWAETKEGKAYIRKNAMSLVSKDMQGNRGIYGLKNIDEFLAELYADRAFQKMLTQIPSDAPKKNLLTRFVEFMSSFFSDPDQAQQSLFAEAVALSEEVLETTRREIYGTDVELGEIRRPRAIASAAGTSDVAFSAKLPTASRVANDLIGTQPTWLDNLKANVLGLGARTQFIDKYAPTEEALKRGKVEDLKANQARYYLRMYDQRMHFTSQAISDGAPVIVEKTRRDGRVERVVETAPGASISKVVDLLKRKDVIKEAGSADDANKLFTLYLAAIRGERVGFDRLNFGRAWAEAEIGRVEDELRSATLSPETRGNLQKKKASLEKRLDSMPTEADIKAAKAEIDANPVLSEAFREARDVYNAYNRDLMKFAMDTGAIGKELGNKLLSTNDYIPYYRMRDGVAQLMIGGETPIRIGNIKDSPHLQELVGGDEAIFDFLTSSVQNTSMLIDMSMKNLATKNLMFELRDVGLAKISKVKGGNAPTGSVTFKKDGEEYFAVVDTDALGIDSELLVKGLAGIPTMFPQMVRVLGMPARLLRRLVVASPVYMARQLVRDSTAAAIASGANMTPVISALRQIGKPSVLERRGITGGQVFTGMPEDQTRLLKEMQAGKIGLTSGLARLEALSAKADALTREAQYQSYREQGLSEMEATLMALESMNFSRRGLSPTMHMLSTLIPFFNAQIQGLDVLYRSLRGDMPFNEQLEVRKKLLTRGAMLFGMSMVYAAMMQDDEAYKNAKVEEKYSNFFMPIPGTDQLLRIPIPFELGYIFKALPEALVNTFAREEGGEEAFKALKFIAKQTVPGLSSYFLPQAIKPALEVALDQSIYTGRDIESAQEKLVESGYRFRDNTTELAREVGEQTGVSPIKLEYLIRGYTGGMGMALVQAVSAPFGRTGPEAATKRPSDVPVVGTLFQPADASGIIDSVYERMNKARQVQETYENLVKKGRQDAAQAYLDRNLDSFALASLAGSFKQQMGEITKYEQTVRASNLTADQKREALDRARQAKINLAKAVRAASDRTERQAAPA